MRASWILAVALPSLFVAPIVAAQTTTSPAPAPAPGPAGTQAPSGVPAPSVTVSTSEPTVAPPSPTVSASATVTPPPPVVAPPPPVVAPPPPPAVQSTPSPKDPHELPPSEEGPKRPPPPGTSSKGLPYDLRPGLELSIAAIRSGGLTPVPTTLGVAGHIAVDERTFVDVRLPLAAGTLGNPHLGVHQVVDLTERVWLTIGGGLGVPLIGKPRAQYESYQATTALWDFTDFSAEMMPFALRVGLETHVSVVELRAQAEPVWGVSTAKSRPHFFAFQHALEAQVGHTFGAGVRYQGVLVGTSSIAGLDHYQGSFELFLRAVRGPVFGRLGIFLPSDTPLSGGTQEQWWGVRASTGYQFD